jgi:hypothetical protein
LRGRRDAEAWGARVALSLGLLRRRHGLLLKLLLYALVDSVGIALGGWVVNKVDTRLNLDRRLRLLLLLLLQLLLLLELELHLQLLLLLLLLEVHVLLCLRELLSLRILATSVVLLLCSLRLNGKSSKLLLQLLLTLGQEKTGHVQLLKGSLVHALGLVVSGWCQDLLGQSIHLTRSVHSILLRHVEASTGGSLGNALLVADVSIVSPLRHIMLRLVVRSGSRDRGSLGLGAQTRKEVRAASAGSWVVDRIFIDGADLGRERDAQPLRVEARSTRAEASGRGIEPGREAVIGVVVSHLSKTASVHALIWNRIKLGIRLECRKCKVGMWPSVLQWQRTGYAELSRRAGDRVGSRRGSDAESSVSVIAVPKLGCCIKANK